MLILRKGRRNIYIYTLWVKLSVFGVLNPFMDILFQCPIKLQLFKLWWLLCYISYLGAATAQSVKRLATRWTVRESNPGGGESSFAQPERYSGPPRFLYNGYQVSFQGVKRPERALNYAFLSNAEVKERVEMYLYSPSEPSWLVIGWILPFLLLPPTKLHPISRLRISGAISPLSVWVITS